MQICIKCVSISASAVLLQSVYIAKLNLQSAADVFKNVK